MDRLFAVPTVNSGEFVSIFLIKNKSDFNFTAIVRNSGIWLIDFNFSNSFGKSGNRFENETGMVDGGKF